MGKFLAARVKTTERVRKVQASQSKAKRAPFAPVRRKRGRGR